METVDQNDATVHETPFTLRDFVEADKGRLRMEVVVGGGGLSREVIEPIVARKVPVIPVSACIGVHVGPAIGVVYECERELRGKISVNPSTLVYAS